MIMKIMILLYIKEQKIRSPYLYIYLLYKLTS
nr:MAG TPA: hypothetical protein [Bacteriophage sp.]